MAKLTALKIEALKPKTKDYEESDGGTALRVIVRTSGAKSWALRYRRPDGRPAKLTLGAWPTISLVAARKAAADALFEVAHSRDPGEAKKVAKVEAELAAEDTVRSVCTAYMKREGKELRSVEHRQRVLDRLIFPVLGARPIAEIKRSEIVRLLDNVEIKHGTAMARMVLAVLGRIFNRHEIRSDNFHSPIVRGLFDRKPKARDRVLDDDELRTIWRHARDAGTFGALIKYLLLTGARRSEATALQWAEIDGAGVWLLPAGRNKVKVDLERPLSKAARTLLAEQPRIGPFYVFSRTGANPFTDVSKAKAEFDKACGVTGWRLHDLRRTARSLMSRAGVPSDHAEQCLGHTIGGVRGTYDRHSYFKEKLAAYEALAAEIAKIVDPPEGDVVDLSNARRRRAAGAPHHA